MANSRNLDLNVTKALSEFDCPICTDIFSPPISICTSGHSICSGCRANVQYCPTCRSTFSNGRNYTLENILNAAQRKCKYQDQGCEEIVQGDLYNSHIKFCTYRDVQCLCCAKNGTKVEYTQFLKHLEAQHRFTVKNKLNSFLSRYEKFPHDQANTSWGVGCYKLKNDVVMFIQPILIDDILYITVWKYPDNTVGLICNMKLSLGKNFMASWKIKVSSFRNTFMENKENGAVAAVARGSVLSNAEMNPADQTYSFTVTVEIEEE